jgi:hypothetical protein
MCVTSFSAIRLFLFVYADIFYVFLQNKPAVSGGGRNGLRCNNLVQPRRSSRVNASPEEKEFLMKLHRFMKMRQTPIGRVPHLGFKESELILVLRFSQLEFNV